MKYKILSSDYDNTLVPFGEKRPRPAVEAAVRKMQAAGGKFVLSTGRAWPAVRNPGQLGAIRFDYAITCNGAYVWTAAAPPSMSAPSPTRRCTRWWTSARTTTTCCNSISGMGTMPTAAMRALRSRYEQMGSRGWPVWTGKTRTAT